MFSDQKPSCYTKLLWEKDNPKCKGGFDITYMGNGTSTRPKCMYYDSCAQRKMASRFASAGLTMDAPKEEPQKVNVQYFPSRQTQQQTAAAAAAAAYANPGANVVINPATTISAPRPSIPIAQASPPPYATITANIPTYLSVPEPYFEDDTFPQYLTRVVLRSTVKAIGHAIAHIFDTTVLRR